MSSKYVCIHGHFYQPPRENPWLESIEIQDSAYPYHDWNERITAECYEPNAFSRILDGQGFITDIVNNYSKINFNVGPTVLAWIGWRHPHLHEAIVEADRLSRQQFSGHGNAIAQAYNHMIMPLSNRLDKTTQVIWGIRDFRHRFGRDPEGMWMPEAAVDAETLDVMAEQGIRYTIVAPNQVSQVRARRQRNWRDASGGRVDPSVAYEQHLPSGRKIAVFVYDGPVSRAVAFEGLLNDGRVFADRVLSAFSGEREGAQLAHIATDGESYGHHHRHGDMALAAALRIIQETPGVALTNYGEFLERHPPAHQIMVFDNSSWSCVHGVERWKGNCGCSAGRPGWNQEWRGPLREALDWLRDLLAPRYEEEARRWLRDPWEARNDYIDIILDRSEAARTRFFERHATGPLSEGEVVRVLKLLEMQRHCMLMYTSCGWFFDELSGLETVQVIQYAGRAIQLAEELFPESVEAPFLDRLDRARSNIPENGGGRAIYDRFVRPARIDLPRVGIHYAVSSTFRDYGERDAIYGFETESRDLQVAQAGAQRLAAGKVAVTSQVTRETKELEFAAVRFGDYNVTAGVRDPEGDGPAFTAAIQEAMASFHGGDVPEVIRILDRTFAGVTWSVRELFRDEQRRVLDSILATTLQDARAAAGQIYDRYAPLMHFLRSLGAPVPAGLVHGAETVLNGRVRTALEAPDPDPLAVRGTLEEVRKAEIGLDGPGLAYALQHRLEQRFAEFREAAPSADDLRRLRELAGLSFELPLEPNLRRVQNQYWEMMRSILPQRRAMAESAPVEAEAALVGSGVSEGTGPGAIAGVPTVGTGGEDGNGGDGRSEAGVPGTTSDQEDPAAAAQWVKEFVDLGQTLRIRVV